MKVYAVKRGNSTGIFESWTECQTATKGFAGAEFKSFNTREEAEAYLEDRDVWVEKVARDNENGYLVAFTDGSFDKNSKRYSYGVQFILPNGDESDICGYGNNSEYIDSNNIIGEVLGVINALDWAISNKYKKLKYIMIMKDSQNGFLANGVLILKLEKCTLGYLTLNSKML